MIKIINICGHCGKAIEPGSHFFRVGKFVEPAARPLEAVYKLELAVGEPENIHDTCLYHFAPLPIPETTNE